MSADYELPLLTSYFRKKAFDLITNGRPIVERIPTPKGIATSSKGKQKNELQMLTKAQEETLKDWIDAKLPKLYLRLEAFEQLCQGNDNQLDKPDLLKEVEEACEASRQILVAPQAEVTKQATTHRVKMDDPDQPWIRSYEKYMLFGVVKWQDYEIPDRWARRCIAFQGISLAWKAEYESRFLGIQRAAVPSDTASSHGSTDEESDGGTLHTFPSRSGTTRPGTSLRSMPHRSSLSAALFRLTSHLGTTGRPGPSTRNQDEPTSSLAGSEIAGFPPE